MNSNNDSIISRGPSHLTLKFKNKTFIYDDHNGVRELNGKPSINYGLYKKNYLYCLNCNKKGHNSKNCRFPTNSYGCILFKESPDNQLRYLMIQRRYTPVYVELLRAKYYTFEIIDYKYLTLLIKDLPVTERYYISTYDFDYLWHSLWRWAGTDEQMQCIYEEYDNCKQKFNSLKKGFQHSQHGFINFRSLFDTYTADYVEPEWEFPKGRREDGESDQQCAIRECSEETTLESEDYKIYLHVKPFQEKFMGINQVKYCNSYYLGELTNYEKPIYYNPTHVEQNKEIRKIGWFTENEIHKLVGEHQKYRLKMISDIDLLVKNLKKTK